MLCLLEPTLLHGTNSMLVHANSISLQFKNAVDWTPKDMNNQCTRFNLRKQHKTKTRQCDSNCLSSIW